MTHTQMAPSRETLGSTIDSLEVGAPTHHDRLTVWPLTANPPGAAQQPGYIPLSEALEKGSAEVEEVSEGGSVPNILIRNHAPQAVLVLFGEEIRGAKQNRVANATFLIPPRDSVVIDVSCVEAGRWSRRRSYTPGTAKFDELGSIVSHSLRHKMSHSVRRALEAKRGYRADQGEVWNEVGLRLSGSGTRSPTASYSDHQRTRSPRLKQIRDEIHPTVGQVGLLAAIDGQVVGLDVIGRPDVFLRYFERLLDAYAIDALDRPQGEAATTARVADPHAFLASLRGASARPEASIGLGEDLRLTSASIEGCALVTDEVVHLTAGPADLAERGG
ncbi:MAG: hypothetical protein JRG76_12440 [Deltaproteobacteria bacterium]|nr:hypothetical protein [Deltaproteobacteria bacterium]MBW2415307.1 hypothetical protein [Deltaproteobacteria bacterium]